MQTAVAPDTGAIRTPENSGLFAAPSSPRILSAGQKVYRAVHAVEYNSDAPDGIEVWKYAFPMPAHASISDVRIRLISPEDLPAGVAPWMGVFECARGRHVDVVPWPEAGAVVISAANAVYIVNPRSPELFTGFAAPVEITGLMFDETGERMFISESLRVYAFSRDLRLRWISEPLEGYGAQLCGCAGRVVAVEMKQDDPQSEEVHTAFIRLRAEDGTILRSRFRLARHYLLHRSAA